MKLKVGRRDHKCAYIPGTNKIVITGGMVGALFARPYKPGEKTISDFRGSVFDSTEIIDIDSETISMGNPMNLRRHSHGIGHVAINGKDKLVVFGGTDGGGNNAKALDEIEIYDNETDQWKLSTIRLDKGVRNIECLNIKLGEILESLKSEQTDQ